MINTLSGKRTPKKTGKNQITQTTSLQMVENFPDNNHSVFTTLSPKEEIRILQQGTIPPEVLYEGIGGALLTEMDNDMEFIYTNDVTLQLQGIMNKLLIGDLNFGKNTKNNLTKISEWIDIGTGNGVVTNCIMNSMGDFFMGNRIQKYGAMQLLEYNKYGACGLLPPIGFSPFRTVKNIFIDLSHTLLIKAKSSIYNDPKLGALFDLEYIPEKFQYVLAESRSEHKQRLITMFNFLTNFKEVNLKIILGEVYQKMAKDDVFIPSFFQNKKNFDITRHDIGLFGDDNIPFEEWTLKLYQNSKTKNRITQSFKEKYKPNQEPAFKVEWIQEQGRQPYVEVVLSFPEDTEFTIDNIKVDRRKLSYSSDGKIKFTAFKSHRYSKEYLTNLLEEIGFGIDGRLETENLLQVAPVLYKKI